MKPQLILVTDKNKEELIKWDNFLKSQVSKRFEKIYPFVNLFVIFLIPFISGIIAYCKNKLMEDIIGFTVTSFVLSLLISMFYFNRETEIIAPDNSIYLYTRVIPFSDWKIFDLKKTCWYRITQKEYNESFGIDKKRRI